MKKVVVVSKSPVKLQAALQGFQQMFLDEVFDVESVSSASGVSDQPMSDAETLLGASNRVDGAFLAHPQADFWIGIEGGCEEKNNEMGCIAWVVIHSRDGMVGKARTSTFYLAPRVAELIKQGMELGAADDIVFQKTDSKKQNGAIGLLTGDVVDRVSYYKQGVILALVPFKNQELYRTTFVDGSV